MPFKTYCNCTGKSMHTHSIGYLYLWHRMQLVCLLYSHTLYECKTSGLQISGFLKLCHSLVCVFFFAFCYFSASLYPFLFLVLSHSLCMGALSCITNVKCCSIQSIGAANGQVIEAPITMIRNPNYVFTNRFLCGPSKCEKTTTFQKFETRARVIMYVAVRVAVTASVSFSFYLFLSLLLQISMLFPLSLQFELGYSYDCNKL